MKSINGTVDSPKNGSVKRRLNRINYETNFQNIVESGLFSFTPIFNRIKTGHIRRLDSFEKDARKYIDEQFDELRSDLLNFDSKIKKLKSSINGELDNFNNENENNNLCETNFMIGSVLTPDKIAFVHKKVLKYFKDTLIVKTSEMGNSPAFRDKLSDGFSIVNQSKLSEENRNKLLEFSSRLNSSATMHLYDLFAFERSIEKEYFVKSQITPYSASEGQIVIDPNEDVIRCICGILREEGNMIQCDKCQVWNLQSFN